MGAHSRRGQYALITGLGMVPAFTIGAMSLDLALASMFSSEAELVAFSAAQTAIVAYDQGKSKAEAEAMADDLVRSHVAFDGQSFTLTEVQWGYVDRARGQIVQGGEIEAARATVARTGVKGISTFFGGLVGVGKLDIGTSAISDTLPSEFDRDDCDTKVEFNGDAGYISSADFDRTVEVLLQNVESGGWYAIYKDDVAESGSTQRNESSYYRVINEHNPAGLPRDPNCEGEHVVLDYDNEGYSPDRVYLGTFWFDGDGPNTIVMHHYCAIRDLCPLFEDPYAQCGDTADSVHFDRGEGYLCLEAL